MALGTSPLLQRFESPREILGDRLREGSIYRLLADEGHRLFPNDYFADLYSDSVRGRPTIPARVMASVMVLQALEGLSDREATDRLEFDLRWQAACGLDTGAESFHSTALVGQRNRLRESKRPRRMFDDTRLVARECGAMKNRARVFDSTPIYDAVATQDTVTQLRSSIRKLLNVLDSSGEGALATRVRTVLTRDDDYRSVGKPPCDWDDPASREQLVDELVTDAMAALRVLEGEELTSAKDAALLLALVAGQDVEEGADGVFRIARKVAKDRVISTVDVEARHGHKSKARKFDGFKAHLSVDPDSELIDEVVATPANTPDREAVPALVEHLLGEEAPPEIVGDAAYGDGATRHELGQKGLTVIARVPPLRNTTGGFTKDRFSVNLTTNTVTCPADHVVSIRFRRSGGGVARFASHCASCPLRSSCTSARSGRVVTIHPHEDLLQQARRDQREPEWLARYRADRPMVERKIAHFVLRAWGGRRARTRGLKRVATDLDTRAAAINLARLAVLGLRSSEGGWAITAT
ncbi:MAG: IS1182 family transposase [Acidimicrobiales bacterium]